MFCVSTVAVSFLFHGLNNISDWVPLRIQNYFYCFFELFKIFLKFIYCNYLLFLEEEMAYSEKKYSKVFEIIHAFSNTWNSPNMAFSVVEEVVDELSCRKISVVLPVNGTMSSKYVKTTIWHILSSLIMNFVSMSKYQF